MGCNLKGRAGSFIVLAGFTCFAAACLLPTNPTRAAETVTYQYDALGRLTKKTSAGTVNTNKKVTVCYDAAGNRKIYKVAANGATVVCPVTAP
jgi:RHS Repeat